MRTSTAIVTLVLLCAFPAAQAADFRTLDYGARCDNLPALESALGSTAFDERLPSGYEFAFRGRFAEHDTVIGYSCRDGALFRGAYIFDVKDQAEATQLYRQLKQRVTRERGKPSYDFASAEHRQKMAAVGATLDLVDTQVAFWNGKRDEAHLSVAEPSRGHGWRVSLSFTAAD
jgi:hypothetical protein